ncbi:MAG: methyltransferase domain-containing protein [Bacteroidota bacterium]
MQLSSLLGHTREILSRIQQSDKPADSLIDSFFRTRKYLGSHDRKFIAETTYGTLRHLRKCQTLMETALGTGAKDFSSTDRVLLCIVTYLSRIDRSHEPTDVILAPLLENDKARNSLGDFLTLLKGVELNSVDAVQDLANEYSIPDWLARKFHEQYGPEESRRLCESLNAPAPLNLRVNTLKAGVDECTGRLRSEGIETTRTKLSEVGLVVSKRTNMFRIPAFKEGYFEVQDEGSQLLGVLVDPRPVWKVLDACAGAGGKTLHMAAIMKNRGEIVASDINEFRLNELRKRARRAGAFNIRVMTTEEVQNQDRFKQAFDVVFIDAPCSGLGTLRRNPGLKWTVTEEGVKELCAKQLHIMETHASFVKEQGVMYYATCSLLREENQAVIMSFLERHPEFAGMDLTAAAGKAGLAGQVTDGFFFLYPHKEGTDGFFCGAVQRKGLESGNE